MMNNRVHKIYFLQRQDGLIKIGTTVRLTSRIAALTKSHGPLVVLKTINGDRQDERRLHRRFASHNEFGEWFRPHPDLLKQIDEIREGGRVHSTESLALQEWREAEAETAKSASEIADRVVRLRRQREGGNIADAVASLNASHRLPDWFLPHLRSGKCRQIGAHAFDRLKLILTSEMEKSVEYYQSLIDAEHEAAALAEKIEAKKAALRLKASNGG